MTELLGDDVAFDYQNAQGEQTNCTTIATKFVSDGCDLIMANATTALQSAAAATADIPIVGTSVTDYVTAGVVDSNEVQSVVTKAVSECDVLYVPTDNTMANNTEIIKNVAVPAGVPVIAGEEGICSGCGVATLSISYYDLGVKAADMAYEILVNGADPAEMPIQYVSEGITEKYNPAIAEELNIAIPEGMAVIGERAMK